MPPSPHGPGGKFEWFEDLFGKKVNELCAVSVEIATAARERLQAESGEAGGVPEEAE
jgi:hypothetical protein